MNIIKLYRCFCDETRLRILNVLLDGPLCVCHICKILKTDQPKISRHLQLLRKAGAVATERCHNWTIYRLPEKKNRLLDSNLKCLQDLRSEKAIFAADLIRREHLMAGESQGDCGNMPSRLRKLFEPNSTTTNK